MLIQLRHNFKSSLRTIKEFEKSIRENEDGFFLSLYKLIADGQMIMSSHLHIYFERQRELNVERWGGYTKVPAQTVVKMQCA